MDKIVRYTIIFLCVFLLQVLIFNNIPAIGMISPYLYILFILVLPVNMAPTMVLLMSFVIGLLVDLSVNSLGVHSCASITMAAVRPTILKILQPRQGYEANPTPIIANFGSAWALKYMFVCVTIHHLTLYVCFTFLSEHIGFMFVRMLINVLLTIFVLFVSEKFILRK